LRTTIETLPGPVPAAETTNPDRVTTENMTAKEAEVMKIDEEGQGSVPMRGTSQNGEERDIGHASMIENETATEGTEKRTEIATATDIEKRGAIETVLVGTEM
jgi:hypothetical protein